MKDTVITTSQLHQGDQQLGSSPPEIKLATEQPVVELPATGPRYVLAMQGASDGLWDWNLETDEVYYSPRWKSMLGYEEHELENVLETWAKLTHPDDMDGVLAKVDAYLAGNADSFEAEMRMIHKDGHIVFILVRAFSVFSNENGPIRMVGTQVDISARTKVDKFNERAAEILEMIALGKSATEIYDAIGLMYEERHPGMRCSMLELEDGKLLHGGAPSMPKEYCDAVHGLEYGPDIGSCGTSTYTGESVSLKT